MPELASPAGQQVDVEVTGTMSTDDRRYAVERIGSLAAFAHRPLRRAHVTFETSHRPAVGQRVTVTANLDVGGSALAARAEGATHRDAVDLLRRRLYSRLARQHRGPTRVYAWITRAAHRR
jgi:ribosome-associated translation inhibitor RaiA